MAEKYGGSCAVYKCRPSAESRRKMVSFQGTPALLFGLVLTKPWLDSHVLFKDVCATCDLFYFSPQIKTATGYQLFSKQEQDIE